MGDSEQRETDSAIFRRGEESGGGSSDLRHKVVGGQNDHQGLQGCLHSAERGDSQEKEPFKALLPEELAGASEDPQAEV